MTISLVQADDLVRSAAYKASDEQAQILSSSGSVLAQLDALLDEISRNGISDDTRALVTATRAKLVGARDGAISSALTQLREVSSSGQAGGIRNIIQEQQQAEIALRRIASILAEKQFSDEIAAKLSAILARQDRAISLTTGVAPEQEAIALQVQELTHSLSAVPADLPAPVASAVKQAAAKAAEVGLNKKAEIAASSAPDLKAHQIQLRKALSQVDQFLSQMVPAKERLEQAAKAVAKMRQEQANLAAAPQPDAAQSDALAEQADETGRKVAGESPAAANALAAASQAFQSKSANAQPDAAKALA
ncbi:MAG: hypothetical protein WCO94_17180, partial [Verrucomicrobiota bacterium]